jgi:SagB-type dehydrogenase family enzyme
MKRAILNKILSNNNQSIYLHKKTFYKNAFSRMNKHPLLWKKTFYKEYPRFPTIDLPEPLHKKNVDFFSLLLARNSGFRTKNTDINLNDISTLFYYSAGIRNFDHKHIDSLKRTYPSAGARYPLELYLITFKDLHNLPQNIYHYNVRKHVLENLNIKVNKKQLDTYFFEDTLSLIEKSSALICISAIFNRSEIKYGLRSIRYTYQEVGHIAQNFLLTSQALKINNRVIGGFKDEEMNNLLDLEEEKEQIVTIVALQ